MRSGILASPPPPPFTFFAPTNEAFAAALATLNVTLEELLADRELLVPVCKLACACACVCALV